MQLCDFGSDGGSAYPVIYDMCLKDLTQKRINEFRQYLTCEASDLNCPVPPTAIDR